MRVPTSTGRSLSAAVLLLGLIAAVVLATVTPARAGENTFVEVTPNTAQAGTRVNIRASCDQNNNRQADVRSEAFGRVILRPDNGFLTGAVTIPGSTQPGDYPVDLRCQNNENAATTTLTVLNMTQPSKGPATGGGGTAGDRGTGSVLLVGGLAAAAAAVGLGFFGNRRRRAGAGG